MISEMGLKIEDCISQCYDGESMMSGECASVIAKIKEKKSSAVYVHCCSHPLNLALVDYIEGGYRS